MDIGRKVLTEREFNNLWISLYKEFNLLFNTNKCDATKVYNIIYAICTSNSSYENKLYWKIGDFLYNRCKEIQEEILREKTLVSTEEGLPAKSQSSYLFFYNLYFLKYKNLVKSINNLSTFLNDCIKSKNIFDFGFLLWERCIIQKMGDSFFKDLYFSRCYGCNICNQFVDSGSNTKFSCIIRINILKSLTLIRFSTDPLFYYSNKYEVFCIDLLVKKYSFLSSVSDIKIYIETVFQMISEERNRFNSFFLKESEPRIENTLETLIYKDSLIEQIKALIANKGNSFITRETEKNTYKGLYEDFSRNLFLNDPSLVAVINKGFSLCSHKNIFLKLCILKKGSALLKKSYAVFVYEILLDKESSLNSKIENILDTISLLNSTSLFICSSSPLSANLITLTGLKSPVPENNIEECAIPLYIDLCSINLVILKKFLQQIKPCYMTRLAEYIENTILCNSTHLFALNNSLKLLINLVPDFNEFVNIYRHSLGKRTLYKNTRLEVELSVIKSLQNEIQSLTKETIPSLSEMLLSNNYEVYQDGENRLRLLNDSLWALPKENTFINLPDPVFQSLSEIIKIKRESFRSENREKHRFYEIRGNNKRQLNFMHGMNTVVMSLGGGEENVLKANFYQFLVLYFLPSTREDLQKRTSLEKEVLALVLESLIRRGEIKEENSVFEISTEPREKYRDISQEKYKVEKENDFCEGSYLQALSARILKLHKALKVETFISLVLKQSRITVSRNKVFEILKIIEEKGIGEMIDDEIHYNTAM